MLINTLYKVVQIVINENRRGKITPSQFNITLGKALEMLHSELFSDFRKLNYKKMRFQDTPNYGDEASFFKQCQEWYISSTDVRLSEGKVNLINAIPDFFSINSLFGNAEYEKVDLVEFNRLARTSRMQPTSCMPLYTFNNKELKVLPKTNDVVEVVYYRKVKTPKWTYRIIDGTPAFSPDQKDFQDIDMHPMLIGRIFTDVLSMLGINLRESMVLQYINMLRQEEQLKER